MLPRCYIFVHKLPLTYSVSTNSVKSKQKSTFMSGVTTEKFRYEWYDGRDKFLNFSENCANRVSETTETFNILETALVLNRL